MEIVAGSYEEIVVGLCISQETGELTETFTEKGIGSVRCVAVSDKGLLASGGTDEVIRLFDLKRRRLVGTLSHHSGTVTSLQFADTHLFSTSDDGTLCLWRVATWQPERTFRGHKGPVRCVAVHPSGKLTLTVGQDKTLRLWNNMTGRSAYVSNLKEPADLVRWSPGGLYYVVSYSTRLEVFSIESKSLHKTIPTSQKVNSVVFVSDNVIAYGGEGKLQNGQKEEARLFFTDVLEGHSLQEMETSCDRIRDMAVRANYLTLVGSDGTVSLYQLTFPSQESIDVDLVASRTISLRLTSVTLFATEPEIAKKEALEEKASVTLLSQKKKRAEKRAAETSKNVEAKKRKVKISEPKQSPQKKKKKKTKKTKELKTPT